MMGRCDRDDELGREELLEDIASRLLGIPTLETQYADSTDFHTIPVWKLKDALSEAYTAGRRAANADLLAACEASLAAISRGLLVSDRIYDSVCQRLEAAIAKAKCET